MFSIIRLAILLLACIVYIAGCQKPQTETKPPNVILIITDDQGFADLGFYGNSHIHTPVLDNFARESIRLNQFHVSPVSTLTRASIMTGRYSLRTGVHDTHNGGAIMSHEEITIADMLKMAGYKTGIFGKWHLGDSYPSRPIDQGFDEALVHLAGGLGHPGDFTTYLKGDSSHFNPVLWHNGMQTPFSGYSSDIFTEQAISFIEKNQHDAFFCYLSFNTPQPSHLVPETYYNLYKDANFNTGHDENVQFLPEFSEEEVENIRRAYAIISNIDKNVGKLLDKLDELNIAENTLIIFTTGNGPKHERYRAGTRGGKGSVYRGGVHVPFFFRLPALQQGDLDIETVTAHIDLLPTLAELCNADTPDDRTIDGISFLPLLKGTQIGKFEKRPLFFYWTQGCPQLYSNIAIQKGHYKLVGNTGYDAPLEEFELFNIQEDEFELHNVISSNKALALEMKFELDYIVRDVTRSPHLQSPPRINVGSEFENPVFLNRSEASGPHEIWALDEIDGNWRLDIREGIYNICFAFTKPLETKGLMVLETNSLTFRQENNHTPTDMIVMNNVYLSAMESYFTPYYSAGETKIFPLWVELKKIN